MRTHVTLGAQTLEASASAIPQRSISSDGSRYRLGPPRTVGMEMATPAGLKETEIPLAGRIVALADVYDALTSRRIYRDAMSHAQARAMILRERGAHFDPDVVDAFVRTEPQFIAIKEQYRDDEQPDRPAAAAATKAKAELVNKVMVVDDDPTVTLILANFLHSMGFECIACADATKALIELEEQSPRVIISDWEMPDTDGLELCRRVKSRTAAGHVHFIMLTVHASTDQLSRAFDAGVDDFIRKPFTEPELMARLRAAMRTLAMHDELSRQNQGSQQLKRTAYKSESAVTEACHHRRPDRTVQPAPGDASA